jgi:hypothetical protein
MALNINKISQTERTTTSKSGIMIKIVAGLSLVGLILAGYSLFTQSKQNQKLSNKVDELQSFIESQKTPNVQIATSSIQTLNSNQSSQTEYCGNWECGELETKTSPKTAKLIGWVGSQNAELNLTFDKEKITGKYSDLYARTETDVVGTFQYYNAYNGNGMGGLSQQTTAKIGQIELDEVKGGLVKGHFSVKIESPGNNIEGIPLEIYKNKSFSVWSGSYKASDSELAYDLYLGTDATKIKNWEEKTIKGTLVIDTNGTYFVQTDTGTYFSRESWQFKDRKTGDKIEITGKVRDYFEKRYFYYDNQNLETKKGIFNITKIK